MTLSSAVPNLDPAIESIRAKVLAGQRLTLEDGAVLYETRDIWSVIELAKLVRDRMHPGVAYYNINRHLNYSNVCALSCKFCEFARKQDDEGSYTRDLDYIKEQGLKALESGATEFHIVGGLNPYLPFAYYTEMLSALREIAPQVHLKAFTAVELVHLARIAKVYKRDDTKVGVRWVLERLKEAGLGSLPGGGAEVFDERVHKEAFKAKIGAHEWLDVHLVAHELGLNTNCTMLYGHVDKQDERLRHMEILRRSQDQALHRLGYEGDGDGYIATGIVESEQISAPVITLSSQGAVLPTPDMSSKGGYYQTITPLPFFPDGSDLENLPGPTGLENLRTLAITRLMLDNFPHVKAFWIMQSLPMAQVMLEAGADDIDGTVVWYDITKAVGEGTHQETTELDLKRAIEEAGYEPVERDTLYRRVVRNGREWRVKG
jgi:aminodeoxyfutalosine synthase